jgi:hypothetical protein
LLKLQPRVTTDDGSGTTQADVASVSFSFREPGTNRTVTQTQVVNYPFAPWYIGPQGFFASPDIAVVQKSFVMLNLYLGIEQACRSFYANTGWDTLIGQLRGLIAAVQDYNAVVQDQDAIADVELVNQLIAVLMQNGVPDSAAPANADPWPAN